MIKASLKFLANWHNFLKISSLGFYLYCFFSALSIAVSQTVLIFIIVYWLLLSLLKSSDASSYSFKSVLKDPNCYKLWIIFCNWLLISVVAAFVGIDTSRSLLELAKSSIYLFLPFLVFLLITHLGFEKRKTLENFQDSEQSEVKEGDLNTTSIFSEQISKVTITNFLLCFGLGHLISLFYRISAEVFTVGNFLPRPPGPVTSSGQLAILLPLLFTIALDRGLSQYLSFASLFAKKQKELNKEVPPLSEASSQRQTSPILEGARADGTSGHTTTGIIGCESLEKNENFEKKLEKKLEKKQGLKGILNNFTGYFSVSLLILIFLTSLLICWPQLFLISKNYSFILLIFWIGLTLSYLILCYTSKNSASSSSSLGLDRLFSLVLVISIVLFFINLKRGPWMGVTSALLLLGFFRSKKLLVGLLLGTIGIFLLITPIRSRLLNYSDDFTITGGRQQMWAMGLELIQDYPLGLGPKNAQYIREIDPSLPPLHRHMHNNFLNVAVETGWLGLVIYLSLIYFLISTGYKHRQNIIALGLGLSFISWQIAGLVEYNFGDGEIRLIALALMGFLLALCRPICKTTCKSTSGEIHS